MSLRLVIGNKNYSSWSLRPWFAMKVVGIRFEETVISLNAADFKQTLSELSGTGKVPVLIEGDIRVWESLAILEYLAERFPDAGLWPAEPAARAHARTIAAEMHAGFVALRRECPMNFWRPVKPHQLSGPASLDVARIGAMWTQCRARFGGGGAFLFGRFGAADAMYAPVVSRLQTYAIPTGAAVRAYMDAVQTLPAWTEWRTAALQETWVLPQDEPDWPAVPKVTVD